MSNVSAASNTVDVYYVRKDNIASVNLAVYKITIDIANGGAQSQPVKLSGDELIYASYYPRQVQAGPKSAMFQNRQGYCKMSVLLNNQWTPFIGLPTFWGSPSLLSDDISVLINNDIGGNRVNVFMVDSVPSIRSFQLTLSSPIGLVIHPRLIRDYNNQIQNQLLLATIRLAGNQYTLEVHDVDPNAGLVRQTYTVDPAFNPGPFDTLQIIQLP